MCSSWAPARNHTPPRAASASGFGSSSSPSAPPKNARAFSSQPGGAASCTWSSPSITEAKLFRRQRDDLRRADELARVGLDRRVDEQRVDLFAEKRLLLQQ